MGNIYDICVQDSRGGEVKMSEFKNKTLLIVNVASKCGLTPQYVGLQKIFDEFKDRNFLVLGFPCNQFGGQEPGSNQEISEFCEINYSVTFPIFSKIKVNGPEAHPLFKLLKQDKPGIFRTQSIKWNFTKFLINNSGKIIERFSPRVEPKYIREEIERVL
ncbi:MAG: glutathione peroxidase [Pseudomonadota bacterium]|jgi:glutathione peroxidase|nr:glutathione peroxidase [Pseudomonadota bacterium]|tara:strand:+ start:1835 stop:2314 length:480 start_codon:yes stop_codon:yes gene_type:complete